MLIFIPHPKPDTAKTTLIANVLAAASASKVQNTAGFLDNMFTVFGTAGTERAEIVKLSGITAPDTISHATGPIFPHAAGESVTKIRYDKIEIYRDPDPDGTYTLITTIDIDIDEKQTIYDDLSGTRDDWYKFRYKNSETDNVSEFSMPLEGVGYSEDALYSIVEEAAEEYGDPDSRVVSKRQWRQLARTGVRMVARALGQLNMPVLTEKDTVVWSPGTEVIPLPERFMKFRVIRVQYTGQSAIRARRINEQNIEPQAPYTRVAPRFFRRGINWGIIPDEQANVVYWADIFPRPMTDATNEHGLPYGARDVIVAYMLFRAWIKKDRDRSRMYQSDYNNMLNEYVQQVADGFQGYELDTLNIEADGGIIDDEEYI